MGGFGWLLVVGAAVERGWLPYFHSPLNTSTASPVMYTWLSAAHSNSRSPPGKMGEDFALGAAGQARRPRRRRKPRCRRRAVSPEPRSQTRMRTSPGDRTWTNSRVDPVGKMRIGSRSAARRQAPKSSVSSSTNVMQCGLPIETQVTQASAVAEVKLDVGRRVAEDRPDCRAASWGCAAARGSARPYRRARGATCLAGDSSSSVRMPRPVSIRSVFLAADAMVVDILGHAADAVAAHLRLGAVGVEHPHPGVGHLAGADQNQSVAADAEMPVGHPPGQRRPGRCGIGSSKQSTYT